MEYFRNHFLTFLQYDGNLLRRDLINCSNQTLYSSQVDPMNDGSSQNNAKENFDEQLPQNLPKKYKNSKQDLLNHNKDKIVQNEIIKNAKGDEKSLAKEASEDELCYELKRNRDKVYR